VAVTCLVLGVSVSWFYKWRGRGPTRQQQRRARLDAAVAAEFMAYRGLHGSPRVFVDLRAKGWKVSEKSVADSMRRQGLVARVVKRRKGLTRRDKNAPVFPDLVRRDFTASRVNERWVGDITEIPTASGKLYLATVIELYSRRLLAAATSRHPDAELASAAIKMAAAVRGGRAVIEGVIFHTDRGSTGERLHDAVRRQARDPPVDGPRRVDNAAAEAFFSTLEWEVLSRNEFRDPDHARQVVLVTRDAEGAEVLQVEEDVPVFGRRGAARSRRRCRGHGSRLSRVAWRGAPSGDYLGRAIVDCRGAPTADTARMGLTSCRWITIAGTLAGRRSGAHRHCDGCRVPVERAAARCTVNREEPGRSCHGASNNLDPVISFR
jgi:transposase InsO family protein